MVSIFSGYDEFGIEHESEGYHVTCLMCGKQHFDETRKASLAWRKRHYSETGGKRNDGHDEFRVT